MILDLRKSSRGSDGGRGGRVDSPMVTSLSDLSSESETHTDTSYESDTNSSDTPSDIDDDDIVHSSSEEAESSDEESD